MFSAATQTHCNFIEHYHVLCKVGSKVQGGPKTVLFLEICNSRIY